ncbi:MAG: hypothetical protein HQM09_18450 [Candidatus Riflebacteria bacterium]|nr:hypothetical protein [Candidatus Riflebacteria bacterium]
MSEKQELSTHSSTEPLSPGATASGSFETRQPRERRRFPWLWLLLPLLDTASQILMKQASIPLRDVVFGWGWLSMGIASPYLWGSIACDISSLVVWIGILKGTDLSFAYPLTGVTYISIAVSGRFIFNEPISFTHLVGIMLIMLGVALISSEPDSDSGRTSLPKNEKAA